MEGRIQKLGAVVGKKGVGKTFLTKEVIHNYVMGDRATGRFGRKVLIMDINDEFMGIPALDPKHVRMFSAHPKVEARRIRPLNPATGRNYSLDDFAAILFQVLGDFRGGMLLLEDINQYISDTMPNDLIGAICTNRHRDCDILIHYQSMSRIQTKVWQNINYIRFHKNTDSVERNKAKFPDKYEMLQIAELIVNKQYEIDQRFYLYVDVDTEKIRGARVTQQMKFEAIDAYIERFAAKEVSALSKTKDDTGKARHTIATARQYLREKLLKDYF